MSDGSPSLAARVGLPLVAFAVIAFAAKVAYDAAPPLHAAGHEGHDGGLDASASEIVLMSLPDADAVFANMRADAGMGTHFGLDDKPTLSDDAGAASPPGSRPKSVRFGVVLVDFVGTQAGTSTRPRAAAVTLAAQLADVAKKQFHDAVTKGDSGSVDDAGRIQRGVLEPATEEALFTLPVGEISAPIETPRGFWIVKRLD